MKVQGLNSSATKTKKIIQNTFLELLHEKKELNKITVTELVKRAEITRSTFYTHYDNIYDVAHEYELLTIELLDYNDDEINTIEEMEKYFDDILDCLKKNENTYKMLLSANETYFFLEKLRKKAFQKISFSMQKILPENKYLDLDINFLLDAITAESLKYFKNESDYTLDEIAENVKKWFNKMI